MIYFVMLSYEIALRGLCVCETRVITYGFESTMQGGNLMFAAGSLDVMRCSCYAGLHPAVTKASGMATRSKA